MNSSDVPKEPLLCYCNKVTEDFARRLLSQGKIPDLSTFQSMSQAGCGPCGGSCQGHMRQLLEEYTSSPSLRTVPAPPLPRDFVKAISLFNRRYYWETHEVLEDMWREEIGERRTFYQGIIQAAAALYHVLNANPRGVLKLVPESLHKLNSSAKGNPWKIDMSPLISALESYKTQSEEILARYRSGFDYTLLPRVEISSELDVE